ncbi:MAG: ABC transporter permease [Spirochaetaceae bacterium]|jgi:ABC-2 type transport system permease protein|nr:ABC transporter permease [Spirochaetaceae bacterium]
MSETIETIAIQDSAKGRDRFAPRSVLAPSLALARKELYAALIAPATYFIGLFFLLFTAVWLYYLQTFFIRDQATLRPYFIAFPLAFILVIPGFTMKSWAEERKTGSIELLLTMPFSEGDLVLGKFFAALGLLAALLVLSLPVPLSILPLGHFDGGVIVCEYLGALLFGASATALGLLLSALSKNQAAAFLGSAAVLLVVMLINQISTTQALPAWLSAFFLYISLNYHFESFAKGLLDSRDLLFFIVSAALFLYVTTRVLVFRKWR